MHRRCCLLVTRMSWNCAYWWPGWGGTGHQPAAPSLLYTISCKHNLVFLKMGEIIARNMLSWLKLLIKLLLFHPVGCLYYCINDARSHRHQIYKRDTLHETWHLWCIVLTRLRSWYRWCSLWGDSWQRKKDSTTIKHVLFSHCLRYIDIYELSVMVDFKPVAKIRTNLKSVSCVKRENIYF